MAGQKYRCPTEYGRLGMPRTIVGVALNYRQTVVALKDEFNNAPYQAAPSHPVLYIKPANTYTRSGSTIELPSDIPEVEVGACLGVVFGRPASRVSPEAALDFIAGYCVVADIYAPHTSFYRPAIKQKCRDGFCPIGDLLAPKSAVPDPDSVAINVRIDGHSVLQANTSDLVRSVGALISEVSQFMTFDTDDILLVGIPHDSPKALAGQQVEIEIAGVDSLSFSLAAQGAKQ